MTARLSRRQILRGVLLSAARLGLVVGGIEAGRQGIDLLEQHRTWQEASRPNSEFLARYGTRLANLRLGASFAPEQYGARGLREDALSGLKLTRDALAVRELRLGIRWNRAVNREEAPDLSYYAPVIDAALVAGATVCMNVGPVRTFRWPEEHVPRKVLRAAEPLPSSRGRFPLDSGLAQTALVYLEELLEALRRDYGREFAVVQAENEPFYPLGPHEWEMSPAYLEAVIERIDAAFPEAGILVTSAGRLHLNDVRDLFIRLLARDAERFGGRLVSGFDFHYKTPLRDSIPVVRYFDQIAYARPFAPDLGEHRNDARTLGFRLEVTEGQAEPYGHFTDPGNSAKHFRYMILRCLNEVLDPQQPALIRIWGVEELTKKMLRRQLTDEHRQIIELIQAINDRGSLYATSGEGVGRRRTWSHG